MTDDSRAPASWEPVAGVGIARLRASMLDDARQFFANRDILMVDTPAISDSAASDPNIESVGVRLGSNPDSDYFLHTSPEYCMKRLLAAGFPDIGQICRVFRDGESGRRHHPEFTMIEWYRRGFELDDMMRDAEQFVASLLADTKLADSASRLSYRDAFMGHAGIDPMDVDCASLARLVGADDALSKAVGDDRDAWLDLAMAQCVAPKFDRSTLTTVFHYPRSQAALSRFCPADPTVSDRFEIFLGDVELANGYVELCDADEQEKRFASDQKRRHEGHRRTRPIDDNLIASLRSGLPACAGVAVGFDRLLMIRTGTDDLRAVQHFPDEISQ